MILGPSLSPSPTYLKGLLLWGITEEHYACQLLLKRWEMTEVGRQAGRQVDDRQADR